ncbi:bromo and FHA domain-containing protein DDB_G0267958 [Rhodamnia argentea]|uniref:Bromo and FHA domain-containing protein DDB_G0267958 n=1 Tax=Rhodamnia argentea TaxID=178133 RepID=A0A8B8PBB7_9MYRT|nr:bromo and FHA domain-containing protein DDB_G0267958 [Rhodamnia argentea]
MAATTLSSSSSLSIHLLHQLRRPQPPSPPTPSPLLSLFLNPHCAPAATAKLNALSLPPSPPKSAVRFRALVSNPTSLSSVCYLLACSRPLSSSSSFVAFTQTPSLHPEASTDGDDGDEGTELLEEEEDSDDGDEGRELLEEEEKEEVPEPAYRQPVTAGKVPDLSVKEKKELVSYAHSLGKKLKCQLVGKSGVTDNVAASFIETLEANELLKIKIHRTCPGELDEVVKQLELVTGSVVVGQIGRTIIIYRPSITKMKAEEKKKQARRVFVRKGAGANPLILKKGRPSRLTGRVRRGRTRV